MIIVTLIGAQRYVTILQEKKLEARFQSVSRHWLAWSRCENRNLNRTTGVAVAAAQAHWPESI